uniref:Uncharacterized protein n=1 Tax=viral metagenome TaxID=1070528 RepID=A0A6M3KCZ6_9ZZZZ
MKRKMRIIATDVFTDALTGRDYKPGDEVRGWDKQRVALYQMRGLVECQVESDPLTPPAPEEIKPAGPPAPEEIKPAGPSESKDADA